MSEPIPFRVTRYRCPHCPRTASSKARIREHVARCWLNPETRGCKTCEHFYTYDGDYGDDCTVGVDLSGRPACEACKGTGWDDFGPLFTPGAKCPVCKGDASEIKPGPIVGCDKWEARRGAQA